MDTLTNPMGIDRNKQRSRTPSVRDLTEIFNAAVENGHIRAFTYYAPRNGVPGSRYEITDLAGEVREFKHMDACTVAEELRQQAIDREVGRVKAMRKPELLEYADEKGIEVTPGQNKPKILETIIDHLRDN